MFMDLQVWGTPEQCYEKILMIREKVGMGGFNGVFTYADMPFDVAEKSYHLFSKEVLPRLKDIPEPEVSKAVA